MPPVVIVGAGPTGLTLALLLANRGIRSVLVERNTAPKKHPAAHILNTRTMEVFREIGVAQELEAACQPQNEAAYISWVVSVTGRLIGREPIMPPDYASILSFSPTRAMLFPQNRLERMLRGRVLDSPLVAYHAGCACEAVQQNANHVTVTMRRGDSSQTETVTGSWLVACDGASSPVRRMLGIRSTGPVFQHMLGVYFTADLERHIRGRESTLYWLMNPAAMGVIISYWMPREWALNVPYFPPQQQPGDFTEPLCREMIYDAVGTRDLPDLQVQDISPWVMSARMAETFQRGRVLLAGDAAHSMPPTGGLGLNTGVQDAHNLAWKLAAVLHGKRDASFLHTYELERRAVAQRNIDISVRNLDRNQSIHALAGAKVDRLKLMVALQNSWGFQQLPQSWQRWLVREAIRVGTSKYHWCDDAGPRGEALRALLAANLPSGTEHYRVGGDLGGVYREGAIVPENSPLPEAADPIQNYRPTTWPGARLPHLWLTARTGERVSNHDVLEPEGFVLFVHPEGRSVWEPALRQAQLQEPLTLRCITIGEGGQYSDPLGKWRRLSEVEPTGAVLVRPDGHVAWRAIRIDNFANATKALGKALQRLRQ